MPINKNAFKRYRVIDMLLRNKMRRFPTLEDITETCKVKLDLSDLSTETIRKDLEHMRESQPNGFDAPIKYDPTKRGYYYTDSDYSIDKIALSSDDVDTLKESIDLIKSIGGSRVSEKLNNAIQKILSTVLEEFPEGNSNQVFLQTMSPPKSRGFENFDLFYNACRMKIPVSIIHYNYQKRVFNSLTIHPFLIKEFENKWYILAFSEKHNEVRIFGLDRIFEPLLLKKKFLSVDKSIIEQMTSNYYGILPIANQEKQEIKIYVSDLVSNYFEAYPIHESQQIMKEPNGYSIINFQLVPTMELTRLFLSYGKDIKIIEPSWLIEYTKKL